MSSGHTSLGRSVSNETFLLVHLCSHSLTTPVSPASPQNGLFGAVSDKEKTSDGNHKLLVRCLLMSNSLLQIYHQKIIPILDFDNVDIEVLG